MSIADVQGSKFSLASALKPPRIQRKYLQKYSWLPDVFRVKGSVIRRIIGPVLTVTVFASCVTYAWSKGKHVVMTNNVLPLLSVVVGLILVFRTSYDRYWEGRKSFTSMTSNIRNLARMIWVQVALPPADEQQQTSSNLKGKVLVLNTTATQLRCRKVEALYYCLSFAYSVKHYLRGEDGIEYEDFTGVLPASFRHFNETGYNTHHGSPSTSYTASRKQSTATSSSGSNTERSSSDATKRVRPKRSRHLSGQTTPLIGDAHQTVEFHPYADRLSIPLPLIIAHELSAALFRFKRDGLLETVGPAGTNALSALVQAMVDQLSAMERVANTPIPSCYGIHLKQCVTLYLFALPFTLVNDLGWITIPVVTVVAFTFMGIEGIADEIEMPFGHDTHDLPLDTYCADLKEEIEYILERLPEGGQGTYEYDDGEGDD